MQEQAVAHRSHGPVVGVVSWVHEGDHDVAGAVGDLEALVVVGQAARVHQQPAGAGVAHGAVVADEVAAAAGVVHLCKERWVSVALRSVAVEARTGLL